MKMEIVMLRYSLLLILSLAFAMPAAAQVTINFGGGGLTIGSGDGFVITPKQRTIVVEPPASQPAIIQGEVVTASTTKAMNLRLGPGTNFDKNGGLGAGAQVNVRCQQSWCQLDGDGRWVSKSGLSFGSGTSAVQPIMQANNSQQQTVAPPVQQQQAGVPQFAGTWRAVVDTSTINGVVSQVGEQVTGTFINERARWQFSGSTGNSRTASISGTVTVDTANAPFTSTMFLQSDTQLNVVLLGANLSFARVN
jgi:uncharacterized protein YraI